MLIMLLALNAEFSEAVVVVVVVCLSLCFNTKQSFSSENDFLTWFRILPPTVQRLTSPRRADCC